MRGRARSVRPGIRPGSSHEFRSELTTDPPRQAALPRIAGREDQGELGRRIKMFGDDLHTAIRNVGDHAVPRQRPGAELNLGEAPAQATLASTTIGCQHVDLLPHQYRVVGIALVYRANVGIGLERSLAIDRLISNKL